MHPLRSPTPLLCGCVIKLAWVNDWRSSDCSLMPSDGGLSISPATMRPVLGLGCLLISQAPEVLTTMPAHDFILSSLQIAEDQKREAAEGGTAQAEGSGES